MPASLEPGHSAHQAASGFATLTTSAYEQACIRSLRLTNGADSDPMPCSPRGLPGGPSERRHRPGRQRRVGQRVGL